MSSPGVYRGDNGGLYFFQSNFGFGGDGRCGWFGFNDEQGWANVFFGQWNLNGQVIAGMSGVWCDVPWSNALGNGQISLRFDNVPVNRTVWSKVSATGGSGGTSWSPQNRGAQFPSLAVGKRDFPGDLLSGVWQTDTGALYYIRELPTKQVFWFAARPDLSAAHVAMGARQGDRVTATWLDIPPSEVRSGGSLSMRVFNSGLMEKEGSSASFGSSRWLKLS